MTRWHISATPTRDGDAMLYNDYGDVSYMPDMYDCDICEEEETPITERWHILASRPSTCEMTEVMWTCKFCASTSGATRHGEDCTHA